MITFTTRNRPNVLEHSLRQTRLFYDGEIVVVDDNSNGDYNEEICKRYDCAYLFNETRRGIPRSKERGFRSLLHCDRQFWFDDDCFPKEGFVDRMEEAMEYQGHLLHLKEWTHIREKRTYYDDYTKELPAGLVAFTGATACFMSFRKDQYEKVKGFHEGFSWYGHWHSRLSKKLAELDEYVAVEDSPHYIHSFDVDGLPPEGFKYAFHSCMTKEERLDELKKWKR
jgi:GT2 family glycosyltransferase